ncbi:MAG: hypothetical protein J4415_03800 [Candidatus Diapherotrites archaeon]|uniref:Uncharacterized protein n=1 Tax=Candidatus Iainarchaeum sp. TaxID=3101447 RepID=A0A8T4KVY3_9ARCH|nr:hypothetical protein [Candidatus Diapherotrites archaeon]
MAMKIRTRRFTISRGGGKSGIGVSYTGHASGMKKNIGIIKKAIKGALVAKKH